MNLSEYIIIGLKCTAGRLLSFVIERAEFLYTINYDLITLPQVPARNHFF